jgi:hypothetical protein
MSKQKTSHKPLFPQQQFTAIKASTNGSHTINTTSENCME